MGAKATDQAAQLDAFSIVMTSVKADQVQLQHRNNMIGKQAESAWQNFAYCEFHWGRR